jgi:hypothetical protein
MRIRYFALAALLLGTLGAHAQETPAKLDAAARQAVVKNIADALRQRYIYPDVGNRAATAVEEALAAGRYNDTEPVEFAQRLTDDLARVAHDRHIRVTTRGTPPPAPPGGKPLERFRDEAGVVRADKLPGNVGYIEISSLPDPSLFTTPLDRAMAALAKTRALIIDVRRNGGGGAPAEVYFISYFLDGKKSVPVNRFVSRNAGTDTFTTKDFNSVPTPFRYRGKPIYVLTSAYTFSGGEALAYDIRALKIATIIGETTGGGANPGGVMPMGNDFAMFVPSGRGENPYTHTNWEGVGVKPDVPTAAADALKVALTKLGVSRSGTEISVLSEEQLFAPRTTPNPESEAAIRRLADEIVRGEPRYDLMSEGWAGFMRARLSALQPIHKEMGTIKSIRFKEVGWHGEDTFDVTYESGKTYVWSISLDKDNKIAAANVVPSTPTP